MNVLFVCSQGRLRSRTAAHTLLVEGNENRYAGMNHDADVLITAELVEWADSIVCMEQSHRSKLRRKFKGNSQKIMVWGIQDVYDYMDQTLVCILKGKFRDLFL